MPFRRLFHRDFVLFLSSDFPFCHFYHALLSITFLYTQNHLFCLPEHSNHNASHHSGKVYIFSSSSFLINQSFKPQNHFSCSLNCLQFCFFASNEVAQSWMLYSRQAATKVIGTWMISIICCLTQTLVWIRCKKKSVLANVIVLKTYIIFMVCI